MHLIETSGFGVIVASAGTHIGCIKPATFAVLGAGAALVLLLGACLSAVAGYRLHRRKPGETRSRAGQAEHLATALRNMSNGLVIIGGDGRIGLFNDRVRQVFHLLPGQVATGMPWQEFIRNIGKHVGWDEARVGRVIANHVKWMEQSTVTHVEHNYDDGSVLSIHCRPLPDGGAVLTYDDVTEERRTQKRMTHMAFHDALTGLPNRVLFREHMELALPRVRRGGQLAVLCLDLDGFKGVNDTLGHPAGDELLRQVARRLKGCTRETDLVARLGGDEFAVVQADAEQPTDAATLAERLVEALRAPFDLRGQRVEIGTSIGVVLADGTGATADELLRGADIALYRAKAEGRGTWRFFEPGMDAEMQARRRLEADLRRALAEGQFELFYQPLIEADTQALTGFEALLRWRHPERGMVSPAEFIPLAEEVGLIRPMGAWVLDKACADAATWPAHVKVAVNLSPVQFVKGDLVRQVERALSASGLPARRLELEITESVLLQDNEATLGILHRLRALGVSIAMDDFGTGYSSLSYLRSFPFDKIKVDQSFVRGLDRGKGGVEIVRAVVGLGKALGMDVLAEGVETAEQFGILRAEGCDELQGYLFGRPVPESEAAALAAGPGHAPGDAPRTMGPAPPPRVPAVSRFRAAAVGGIFTLRRPSSARPGRRPGRERPDMTETTPLHRLVYCSRNAIADAHDDVEREVEHILTASRRNNPRDGVTGALLYSEGCFAQVLEGPLAAVERTFERIQCDFRHADVVVLESRRADARMFGDWSMAYGGALGAQAAARLGLKRAFTEPGSLAAEAVMTQLRDVVRGQAGKVPA